MKFRPLAASPKVLSIQGAPSAAGRGRRGLLGPPDANEPGGPAPCRKWLRRGRGLRAGPRGRAGTMAASEAAAAGSAALAAGARAVPVATRGAAAAAASGPWVPPGPRLRGSRPRPAGATQQPAAPAPPAGELIQPSVSELSRAVRTNILCTVRGCGKILPNSPALNMHLVKSHRLQVSPTRPAAGGPGGWAWLQQSARRRSANPASGGRAPCAPPLLPRRPLAAPTGGGCRTLPTGPAGAASGGEEEPGPPGLPHAPVPWFPGPECCAGRRPRHFTRFCP